MTNIIKLNIKEKVYKKNKKSQISILNNFKLEINAGEKIAIVGESGVGKSSLLNIIGLLDRDYDGEYTLMGRQRGIYMKVSWFNDETKRLVLFFKSRH